MDVPAILSKAPTNRAILWHPHDSKSESFTYGEVAEATFSIHKVLINSKNDEGQNRENDFVGVLLGHEPAIVPVLLGILHANQPFLCVDPSASSTSILAQLNSFSAGTFLSAKSHDADPIINVEYVLKKSLRIFGTFVHIYQHRNKAASNWSFPQRIMFGVCTSGSTGTPKSMAVPFQCFMPNVQDLERKYLLAATDRVCSFAPPTFDPFILDLAITLRATATLVLISPAVRLSTAQLEPLLFPQSTDAITVMSLTPSLLYRFTDATLCQHIFHPDSRLRLLILGGEPCPTVDRYLGWQPHWQHDRVRVIHLYGLTEVSCWSMAYELQAEDFVNTTRTLPMGEVICADDSWSLCDQHTKETIVRQNEERIIGELVLHSAQRFTYQLRADGTFQPSATFIHTGDIVEYMATGQQLHYHSRADHMIKRFGTRVSPLKIEEFVRRLQLPGIVSVRCLWLNERGEMLLLFVNVDKTLEIDEVRKEILKSLRAELTANQQPDELYVCSEWPVTGNGKFDWREAMRLDTTHNCRESRKDWFVHHIQDRFGLDAQRTDWWDTSFAFLGGNSFEAMYVVNRLTSTDGHQQMPDLIGMLMNDKCTIRQIVERLGENETELAPPRESLPSIDCPPAAIRWSFNMHKCVDATPTILRHENRQFIAIGSHSHMLLILKAADGSVQSKLQLPDRIESRVRQFGDGSSWAAVGCYDGILYAFEFMSGESLWTFKTGGMIKTQPLAIYRASQECLVIGSYLTDSETSPNVWCVNAETGVRMWKLRLGTKSVAASPIGLQRQSKESKNIVDVLICTLEGTIARLDSENCGAILWKKQLGSPIFATPFSDVSQPDVVFVAEVQGIVHCIRSTDGIECWQFTADGNVFSSFGFDSTNKCLLFGCQDASVYCLNALDGMLLWRYRLDGPVNASPLVVSTTQTSQRKICIACSTSGLMVRIDVESGKVLDQCRVNGPVFSSPVELADGGIVFGSRDDFVYCVELDQL